MGMDVYGKNAKSEHGKYFRNNVWWWRPLADYVCEVAPEITSHCQYWGSNDGDGLSAYHSRELAKKLQQELDSGQTAAYAAIYEAEQARLPDEPCEICGATGIRLPVPKCGPGDLAKGGIKCNGCDGTGHTRPFSANYPFSVENVQEFVEFLRDCGGFEIC